MYTAGQDVSDLKKHVSAIATFLRGHEWLWRAHVVDFFQAKLWQGVDEQWNSCLRHISVEALLLLPSGVIQEEWPNSLKDFVQTAFQLSLSRAQVDSSSCMSLSGVSQAPIGSVLGQGMSVKKIHEIGILAALIAATAKLNGAKDVIDVGAGQGYLALVLAFEYRLSVIAVDACAHHADVTNKRALRIQKHYDARSRKSQHNSSTYPDVRAPRTVTCRVGVGESPAPLSSLLPAIQESNNLLHVSEDTIVDHGVKSVREAKDCGVVLAGLHACGDLSATMLRTFIECKEVASVINVGCCYNLLSEETSNVDKKTPVLGFPMSEAVANLGLDLGRSARDLACQSADRWKEHHPTKAALTFELHAFRAAFQMVLERYYPETARSSPSVGRLGKSRRRRQARQSAMKPVTTTKESSASSSRCSWDEPSTASQDGDVLSLEHGEESVKVEFQVEDVSDTNGTSGDFEKQAQRFDEYAKAALDRLDLSPLSSSVFHSIWREVAPFKDLVGPFYSLRAVLASVIETYVLLDRLLYVKEQAEKTGAKERITVELVPLFEPSISPRNMAIIAHRSGA